jgi:hypothetical protein
LKIFNCLRKPQFYKAPENEKQEEKKEEEVEGVSIG